MTDRAMKPVYKVVLYVCALALLALVAKAVLLSVNAGYPAWPLIVIGCIDAFAVLVFAARDVVSVAAHRHH